MVEDPSDARHPAAGPLGTTTLRQAFDVRDVRVEPMDVHVLTIPAAHDRGNRWGGFVSVAAAATGGPAEPGPIRATYPSMGLLGTMGHT